MMLTPGLASASGGSNAGGNAGGGGLGGGGLGGGGLARRGGRTGLNFSASGPINGVVPRCAGTVSISTYVTILTIDLLAGSLNLPDGTQLEVTVLANDFFTGRPWPAVDGGTMSVLGKKAALHSGPLYVTSPGGLPVITGVIVSLPDGTIVFTGRP